MQLEINLVRNVIAYGGRLYVIASFIACLLLDTIADYDIENISLVA
jgi:hypothetical protein